MPPKVPDNVVPFRKSRPAGPPFRFRLPGFLPAWLFSTATGWLIVANVAIYLGMVMAAALEHDFGGGLWDPFPSGLTYSMGSNIAVLIPHEPWRLLTSAFLHAGILHVAFNMLFLGMFGRRLENAFGYGRYLAIYLGAALGGALVSAGWQVVAAEPASVGASGAIMGIVGGLFALSWKGYGLKHPTTTQYLAFALVGFLVTAVAKLLGGDSTDNACHIGGFLAGIGVALLFVGRKPWSAFVQRAVAGAFVVLVVGGFAAAVTLTKPLQYLSPLSAAEEAFADAINKQDWVAADKTFQDVLRENPRSMQLRLLHAEVLENMNRPEDSLAELHKAYDLEGSADNFGELALMLQKRGDLPGARKAAAKAHVKDRNNVRWERLYQELKEQQSGSAPGPGSASPLPSPT